MTTSASRGSDSEMSRRLCSRAPETTMQFLVGGIHQPVYVPEQTFARPGVRPLRRCNEVGAKRAPGAAEYPPPRANRGERGLVDEPPVRTLRAQARVVERVLRVAVDGRPRVPEDPPQPERPPGAHVERVRLAQALGLPRLGRLPVLRQRRLLALRRGPRQLREPDRLARVAVAVHHIAVEPRDLHAVR